MVTTVSPKEKIQLQLFYKPLISMTKYVDDNTSLDFEEEKNLFVFVYGQRDYEAIDSALDSTMMQIQMFSTYMKKTLKKKHIFYHDERDRSCLRPSFRLVCESIQGKTNIKDEFTKPTRIRIRTFQRHSKCFD